MYTAYEQEIYSKIPEFVDFWETLANSHSHWLAQAEIDAAKLRAAAAAGGTPAQLHDAADAIVKASKERTPRVPSVDSLRFNEDLSTRPEWYCPSTADARLAVGSWWAQAESNPAAPAASQLWWGVTSAAERDCEQAKHWRIVQRAALERRRALPHVFFCIYILLIHLLISDRAPHLAWWWGAHRSSLN